MVIPSVSLMAMPVNMILAMYVIYNMYIVICFQQINNVVYTCTYLSLIAMTNKSRLTFFLSIKCLSVFLSVGLMLV